jgi:capsular exopolysaccharide synthesis family protein
MLMRDTYEAHAQIEILQPPVSTVVTLREGGSPEADQQDYFQTQIEILKGDALALAVIQKLQLDKARPQRSATAVVSNFIARIIKHPNPNPNPSQNPVEAALDNFKKQLAVEQVRKSRVVDISYSSPDAPLAARIVNTLVDLYLERTHRAVYDATMKAAESLSTELEDLRGAVKKANQAVVDFQNAHGILELSDGGPNGSGIRQNPVTERAADLNRQLDQAEAERIQQESFMKLIQSGNADSLPQMRDNPILQDLTKRHLEARSQVAQAMATYGQNHPNAKKLLNQEKELTAQLAAERQRIVEQVKTSYRAALIHERLLTQDLAGMKNALDNSNENMVGYNLLKKDAQAKSDLYITVSSRLNEAAISGSLSANNIRIVEQARIPVRPTKPKRLQNILLGGLAGVLAAVALAFVKERLDDTIHGHEEVKMWTGLSALAMFPVIAAPKRDQLPARSGSLLGNGQKKSEDVSRVRFFLQRPRSAEAEAVRNLVTSIRMANAQDNGSVRVILLASPLPNEGKTTIAVNLGIALGQHNKTCLVDTDLRSPAVAPCFGLSVKQGLQGVLAGSVLLKDALQHIADVPNLTILPASPVPALNPGELVASERMGMILRELRQHFDYVLIDSPPVIPYADARWLSSLSDAVVLVARCGSTTRRAIAWTTEMLNDAQAPILGVVLNAVDLKSKYYEYEKYYADKKA